MKETDLAKPVAEWLRGQGCTVYSEVPWMFRCIDMVGLKDPEIIIVELKTSLTHQVKLQAYPEQLITNSVYVAVGTNPKRSSIESCKKLKLGVLSVKKTVKVLLKPSSNLASDSYRARMIEGLSRLSPSDDAGKACQRGCGPAQYCQKMVARYKKENPSATWKEIYDNVPNHYCNARSLASAMSMVQTRIAIRKYREEQRAAE